MNFGSIDTKVADFDYQLPPDPVMTTTVLTDNKSGKQLQVYVGAAKWGVKSWLGDIYPKGTKETDFLQVYADNFNTVEFGATFYNTYSPEVISTWDDKISQSTGFMFVPKFPQSISHIRRFRNVDELTMKFYEGVSAFHGHLGPLMLQLSDKFSPKSFPDLQAYLEKLPKDPRVFVEVRHKDWFALPAHRDKLFEVLKELGIGSIISDTVGRRDCVHMQLTTPDAMVRFVSSDFGQNNYKRLDEWVARFKTWRDQGLQSLWFFIHNYNDDVVPVLCHYLITHLNNELGIQVRLPQLLNERHR